MTITNKEVAAQLRGLAEQLDPPVVTPTPGPPSTVSTPLGLDGAWRSVFADDFTAGTLDLAHWRRGRPADAAGGHVGYATDQGEKTFYLGQQVSLRDGQLVLTASNEPVKVIKDPGHQGLYVPKGSKLPDGTFATSNIYFSPQDAGTWQYPSGTITTGPDRNGWLSAMASGGKTWTTLPAGVQLLYGAVEARIKLPKGQGLWPAFWLMPVDGSWSYEIDILEQVDPTGQCVAQHLHANNGAVDFTSKPNRGWPSGVDLTTDFHTYAVNWQPGLLQWLVDGKVTQETKANIPNVPMYVILNLAVGGKWGGDPDASTRFPAEMVVDYVTCWQKA